MPTPLNLQELGERLRYVDQGLIALLSRRMSLALQIEEFKHAKGLPIFRPDIELKRLHQAEEWAKGYGINAEFARSIMYMIINEACKTQMIQWQGNHEAPRMNEDEWDAQLRENTLVLARKSAPFFDELRDTHFPSTKLQEAFELSDIKFMTDDSDEKNCLLDLGCATGRQSLPLKDMFDHVTGYDIGQELITVAQKKIPKGYKKRIAYRVWDVEKSIPLPSASVSHVLLGMGSASELRNIRKVLEEVHRVLIHGGLAFLSFYNKDTYLYKWKFLPWITGLARQIDVAKECVEVRLADGAPINIYGRAYGCDEIEDMMPRGLPIIRQVTHPVLSSILPDVLLDNGPILDSIANIDKHLENENVGAYIYASARKS